MAGVTRRAAWTLSSVAGLSSVIRMPVPVFTRLPTTFVAASAAVPDLEVRITARSGFASAPPSVARAVVVTVTVYSVPASQWATGPTDSVLPSGLHEKLTAASGLIRRAAATDAASIGASKATRKGRFSP